MSTIRVNVCKNHAVQLGSDLLNLYIEYNQEWLARRIIAEDRYTRQFRELFIHSFPVIGEQLSGWKAFVVDPATRTPHLELLTLAGGQMAFRSEPYTKLADIELPVEAIRFLTDEERARFSQLSPEY